MFIHGWSVDDCIKAFEKLAKAAFQRRKLFSLPFFPRILELLISYFTDGLYPPENIEVALKQVFGTSRSILDYSHATETGTRVGLPVATVDDKPSCRIFTNYNGVGERAEELGMFRRNRDRSNLLTISIDHVIKPDDGHAEVPLWEM
jgi:hypothetical protein